VFSIRLFYRFCSQFNLVDSHRLKRLMQTYQWISKRYCIAALMHLWLHCKGYSFIVFLAFPQIFCRVDLQLHRQVRKNNDWISQGIKVYCIHRRSLYVFTKEYNYQTAKARYIKHCKILREIIKAAKQQHYIILTEKSNDKIKGSWKIIKKETDKVHSVEQVTTLVANIGKGKDSIVLTSVFK